VGFWRRSAFVRWQALALIAYHHCKVFLPSGAFSLRRAFFAFARHLPFATRCFVTASGIASPFAGIFFCHLVLSSLVGYCFAFRPRHLPAPPGIPSLRRHCSPFARHLPCATWCFHPAPGIVRPACLLLHILLLI